MESVAVVSRQSWRVGMGMEIGFRLEGWGGTLRSRIRMERIEDKGGISGRDGIGQKVQGQFAVASRFGGGEE